MHLSRYLLFTILFGFSAWSFGQQLEIIITNVRNDLGNLRLAFYNTPESFDNELPPFFTKVLSKTSVINGELKVSYDGLPQGVYGVALLDDENSNKEMDYRFFMPIEGFGFSDYYHTGMTRPKFEKFKFSLGTDPMKIKIKIRYF